MKSRVEVRFLPSERTTDAPAGSTLFAAAHWAGVDVDALCGGSGTCGRCRVRLSAGAAAPTSTDRDHLSDDELASGWRLACVTRITTDCVCSIPEVPGPPRIAIEGTARPVRFEPTLRRVPVHLDEPAREDPEIECLGRALAAVGLAPDIDRSVAPSLRNAITETGRRVEAVLCDNRLLTVEPASSGRPLLGVAVDLGTTSVAGSLLDLTTGEILAQAAMLNRQSVFGADVISRIAYAGRSPTAGREMQRAAIETLDELVADLCGIADAEGVNVYQMMVVGNPTMLHLVLGVDAGPLAVAPFVPLFRDAADRSAAELGLDLHPAARLETLPVLGAYVGADTVAGLHATDLLRGHAVRLFIDVGTNSEIALALPGRALATSAPAGPAFEGSGIRCGMTAADGAIHRVRPDPDHEDGLSLDVIGDGEPRGVCGSGIIDALACLLRAGLMDPTGLLRHPAEGTSQPLAGRLTDLDGVRAFRLADRVLLSQKDIRALQSAKSALATGIEVLLETADIGPDDIDEILLAGSFGSAIDPASAVAIGMVPDVPVERVRFVGNVATEGARMALLSFRERQMARELPERVEYVELSAREDFNDRFLSCLGFPKVRS